MLLAPGTRIGPYEVVAPIGAGGMGEVYRASDSRLHRDVALKIVPSAFASDPDRLARFGREAQLLAALSHPNIAHIYGVEEVEGMPALVLELVEGPTLADRLLHGPIDLTEALRIALQIALALETAHDHSIIHRDLKPSNIKVRDDGTVKVLDFGLAKVFDPQSSPAGEAANSPTITNRATALGVILGTAAYMAPEQAKGKPVDKRADIWSFGVVLFEMLTGRRLFGGDDVSDTLAEVLKTTPDWEALPPSTPAAIQRLLRRCLDRDLKSRLHDIADARLEIEEVIAAPNAAPSTPSAPLSRRERWAWVSAVAAAAAIAALATAYLAPDARPLPEIRLHVTLPPSPTSTVSPVSPISLSPDGQTLAFWANTAGTTQIWIRPLGSEAAHPLPGSAGAGGSFAWSPDGTSILFNEGQSLREVSVLEGTSHALPIRGTGFGLTRNADGLLLFAPANAAPILGVLQSGGQPEPVTRITPPQVGHRFPHFLPDGEHFLFLVSGPPGTQGIFLGRLGSLEARRLVDAETAAVFAPPDFIVFGRQEALFAQRLNMRTLEIEGAAIPVGDRVAQGSGVFGSVVLAAAANTIAYRQATAPVHRLRWFDRAGTPLGTVGEPTQSEVDGSPQVSPDGRTILLTRRINGNTDLWSIANTPQGALQRITSNPWLELRPVWSPDGAQIAFQSSRKGGGFYDLYRRALGGSSEDVVVLESDDNKTMNDWSLDNRYILYVRQGSEQIPRDLWAMPVAGGPGFAVTSTPYDEVNGRFSPDTRWVAYQSNAAGGGYEVYVRPFPGPGREWRISRGGGRVPSWRSDGRELYYVGPDDALMAVPITLPSSGDAIEHGAAVRLFAVRGAGMYTPAPDGRRFLINEIVEDAGISPITVIVNWRQQADQRAIVRR